MPHGITMGFAQALALIPGVSRSGGTISAGLFLGLTRAAAARCRSCWPSRRCSRPGCSRPARSVSGADAGVEARGPHDPGDGDRLRRGLCGDRLAAALHRDRASSPVRRLPDRARRAVPVLARVFTGVRDPEPIARPSRSSGPRRTLAARDHRDPAAPRAYVGQRGRRPGRLDPRRGARRDGRGPGRAVVERLAGVPLAAVVSSPALRCEQTASRRCWADRGLRRRRAGLGEADYGDVDRPGR